jgi:hypothetical protein
MNLKIETEETKNKTKKKKTEVPIGSQPREHRGA